MELKKMSEEIKVPTAPSKTIHLPTILLGVIVAVIFLMAIFTYQVPASERALVITMGRITAEKGPGLHLRWPLPIQEVLKYDVRLHRFDGKIGKLEETNTSDQKNIIVGIYVIYRLSNLETFKNAAKSLEDAENYLGSRMRTVKGGVVGRFRFDEMINTDPKKMKLIQMQNEMRQELAPDLLSRYGLEIVDVGIRAIAVPEKSATEIAKRMKEERVTAAEDIRKRGETEAMGIRTNADRMKKATLSDAEAKAKTLMAQGDAEAAKSYSVFNQAPELASFLRKLDSLKKIMSTKTTLVLDTNSTPFDIFNMKIEDKTGATNKK